MKTFELNNIKIYEIDDRTARIQFLNIFDSTVMVTRHEDDDIIIDAVSFKEITFYNKNSSFDNFYVERHLSGNGFEYQNMFDYVCEEVKEYFNSQSKFILSIISKIVYEKLTNNLSF